MAIRDLITSDPYYQNLVNPRGFPTGNDPYVAPTFDDPEPEQIQPEFGIQSIINPYLPQNQGSDNQPPFDPILQQLIRGQRPENSFGMKIPSNQFYENENSIAPNFYENENSIAPNQNTNYDDIDMSYNNESFNTQPQQGILQGLQNKIGGLRDFLPFGDKSLTGLAAKGLKSLFERDPNAPSYQTYDPTGKVDYSKLNTTNLNDFYDSNPDSEDFGTTRFDRAAPGSFGSFRTLADYFNRNKKIATTAKTKRDEKKAQIKAQKELEAQQLQAQKELQAKEAQIKANRIQAANQQNNTGGYQSSWSGNNDFMDGPSDAGRGNNPGDKGGSDTMGSSKDGGIMGYGGKSGTPRYTKFKSGGRVRYRDGGIASMFTRRG